MKKHEELYKKLQAVAKQYAEIYTEYMDNGGDADKVGIVIMGSLVHEDDVERAETCTSVHGTTTTLLHMMNDLFYRHKNVAKYAQTIIEAHQGNPIAIKALVKYFKSVAQPAKPDLSDPNIN